MKMGVKVNLNMFSVVVDVKKLLFLNVMVAWIQATTPPLLLSGICEKLNQIQQGVTKFFDEILLGVR